MFPLGHTLITTGDSEVGVEYLRKLVRGFHGPLCQIYDAVDLIFPNRYKVCVGFNRISS